MMQVLPPCGHAVHEYRPDKACMNRIALPTSLPHLPMVSAVK